MKKVIAMVVIYALLVPVSFYPQELDRRQVELFLGLVLVVSPILILYLWWWATQKLKELKKNGN